MRNATIDQYEKKKFKDIQKLPSFRPGDRVRIEYRIQEGADKDKFRVQPFEGVVIRYKKGTVDSSFTVRKIGAGGIGVERVFPAYSPNLDSVKVLARGVVRRSRLFYLRERSGKAARIKSRFHADSRETN